MIKRWMPLIAASALSVTPALAVAQQEAPTLLANWDMDVLVAHPDESILGSAVADWLETRDVSSLDIIQTAIALDALSYGGISTDSMSVRWEGQITAPTEGTYTFSRGGVPNLPNDWMKVWVDGELILDTSQADPLVAPVVLRAETASIRVEFSRYTLDETSDVTVWPIPCARMMWSLNGGISELVGSSHLAPLVGDGLGLSATYFSDAAFETEFRARLDPAIDLIWDDEKPGTAANQHAAVRSQLAVRVTNAAYISALYEDLGPWDASTLLTHASRAMSGVDKEQVALLLLSNPGDFATMNGYALAELMWQVQPVSTDLVYDLLVAWAQLQPRYETKLGEIPGWHRESYLQQNWNRLAHLGRALCGRYSVSGISPVHVLSQDNYERLLEETGLARADGSPNLHLIPIACYAGKKSFHQSSSAVLSVIENRLADESLTGDLRAQWLVALALCKENHTADTPHVGRALHDLERALAVAESVEIRFWVLSEMVTRLISMGEDQWALSLLDSIGHQFTDPSVGGTQAVHYAMVVARWREQAPVYAEKAAQDRVARRIQGNIDRVIAEITDLELIIVELQEQRVDEGLVDAVDVALANVQSDLVAAQTRLEAMTSTGQE